MNWSLVLTDVDVKELFLCLVSTRNSSRLHSTVMYDFELMFGETASILPSVHFFFWSCLLWLSFWLFLILMVWCLLFNYTWQSLLSHYYFYIQYWPCAYFFPEHLLKYKIFLSKSTVKKIRGVIPKVLVYLAIGYLAEETKFVSPPLVFGSLLCISFLIRWYGSSFQSFPNFKKWEELEHLGSALPYTLKTLSEIREMA